MSKSAFVTLHRINRRQSSSLLSFLITFFCPWKIEHQNNPQRTADKIQSPFKNRQNNNERRHSHLAATGWKWQNKGDTVTKVPKPTTPLTFNFQSVNCLLPRRISFSTTYTTAHGRKRGKNRVHKQGIKLPLYKNRSFSKCFFFFSFFFPLEHFTVYATKKAVIVSQAQLFLITLFEHTIAKQHIHFGGFKVLTFYFFLMFFFLSFFRGPRNCCEEAGSFEFRAAAILLVDQGWF